MHRFVTHRSLGVLLSLVLAAAGCHTSMNKSSEGQTPVPGQTTMAQANSTAAPDNTLSSTPSDHYFAKVSSNTHGVAFSVWANGRPIMTVLTPGQSIDITADMRGHANRIAVQWNKRSKDGAGTITVGTVKKAVMTVTVGAKTATKGQTTKTIIASQSPVSR
ncbi:MAG TPA: hypothetical protein VGZ02_17250 [Candidatus Baltobacteraceae bacterium]|jgi:hypothetical protein|nr:hypothetical protein [Candidatus Baltobacteraceae bacterium]